MVLSIILAFVAHGAAVSKQAVSGLTVWEETPAEQMRSGYHPMIRFGDWDITRFTKSSTYMFASPGMVQQGQFSATDGQYSFRAVMANELENADIAKLKAEMNPEAAAKLAKSYAESMSNFEGSYDQESHTLTIAYPIDGRMSRFSLHPTNDGDDKLISAVSGDAAGMVGLWHGKDPHPERIDGSDSKQDRRH